MADFIPANSVARVEMIYTEYGNVLENIFHFWKGGGEISLLDMELLVTYMSGWFTDHVKTYTTIDLSLTKIRVRDLTASDSMGIEEAISPAIAGIHNSPGLPTNVTGAVKLNTQYSGRSFRGRSYICGLCEDSVVGDTIEAGVVTQVISAYRELVDTPPTGFQYVVVSFYSNHLPRANGVITPILYPTMDGFVDSQRRRLSGRGQ